MVLVYLNSPIYRYMIWRNNCKFATTLYIIKTSIKRINISSQLNGGRRNFPTFHNKSICNFFGQIRSHYKNSILGQLNLKWKLGPNYQPHGWVLIHACGNKLKLYITGNHKSQGRILVSSIYDAWNSYSDTKIMLISYHLANFCHSDVSLFFLVIWWCVWDLLR